MKRKRLVFSTSNVNVREEDFFYVEAKYQCILNGQHFESSKTQTI